MRLIYKAPDFICESTFAEKDIPKAAGFRWNPNGKFWYTQDVYNALRLKQFASSKALAELNAFEQKKEESIAASKATDANIEIPVPEGLEYLPYQRAGIGFALLNRNVLFGDEMGLGKTIQALGVINADAEIKKIIVICPASLKLNWKREAERWLVRNTTIEIADSKNAFPQSEIVIINYDIIKKFKVEIDSTDWDLMILDEVHYLKNTKAQRTQLVFGKYEKGGKCKIEPIKASRKLALTGTPIVNRPVELWPIIHALDAKVWGNFWGYAKRYCGAYQNRYGWDMSGATNLEELQEKLRMSVMVRRLKKDVLTELPPKRRQVIELPANGCAGIIDNETKAWARHQEMLEELKAAVELSKASENPADYENAVARLREGTQAAFTEISKIRHETALAKVPYVIEHLESIVEEGNKVVVFAHHKDVISELKSHFTEKAVILTGDTKMEDRQLAVDRFQNDDSVKLFIGSITAAGVGLTLTASSHVVFAELDWVPGNLTQAEDRTHRIGQTESVLVQHLVLEGSLDATMANTLVAKQNVIDRALDKEAKVEFNIPTIPNEPEKFESKSKIDTLAESLKDEEIPNILQAIKQLSFLCDGANTRDGYGFNKIDARIGHSLAENSNLTKRQAALAKSICRKYKRQLSEYGIEL